MVQILERAKSRDGNQINLYQDRTWEQSHLRKNAYIRIERSEIPELADLDLVLLSRCVLIGETD